MSAGLGIRGAGARAARARYGRALALGAGGRLSEAQLGVYRAAAGAGVNLSPGAALRAAGLPPPREMPSADAIVGALVTAADRYLSGLAGPGVAEVRALIARWGGGPVRATAGPGRDGRRSPAGAVVARHLDTALDALWPGYPDLAAAIAAAAPVLDWIGYQGYEAEAIGADFPRGHAFCSIIGEAGAIAATDVDFGLFLIAPHVLYRDHAHPAPELYAPLTGPHGWRFGPGQPLETRPAHRPVWNPPHAPHLTKVGTVPFLCFFGWTGNVAAPAYVLPAADWPDLEALRLG